MSFKYLYDLLRAGQLSPERFGQCFYDPVGGYADGLAGWHESVFDNSPVFLLTQDNADSGVLPLLAHLFVENAQVELHLADILRLELADLELDGDEALESAVEKQQIDEILPALDLQAELAADKSEHASHSAEEILDAADQGTLQLALRMLVAQLQKIEGVFVPDSKPGPGAQCRAQRRIEICLTQQAFFVTLIFDLVDENVFRPAEFPGHANVEFALQEIFAAGHDDQIMAPCNFSNQRLEFWRRMIFGIQLPHIPKVLNGISAGAGKLPLKVGRKNLYD